MRVAALDHPPIGLPCVSESSKEYTSLTHMMLKRWYTITDVLRSFLDGKSDDDIGCALALRVADLRKRKRKEERGRGEGFACSL